MSVKPYIALTAALTSACLLAGCSTDQQAATTSNEASAEKVTVTNCGEQKDFPLNPVGFANDGNLIAYNLELGVQGHLTAVSSLNRDRALLHEVYGDAVDQLKEVNKEYPSLEQIIAESPQVYYAGWGYGLGEDKNITPESLSEQGIDTYILTEACRKAGTTERGVVDPWEAVRTDLKNIGAINGQSERAEATVKEMDERLDALKDAPAAANAPTVFLFDSGTEAVYTSGSKGAPSAIVNAAGATFATDDIDDTWLEVGWEKIAAAQPDVFVFVDYPGQSFEEKVALLKQNPATKNLEAVKQERFINLPYVVWTSSPLNIDGAETVRKALERFQLVPESTITPKHDVELSS